MNRKLQIMAVLLGVPGFLIQSYGLVTGWAVLSLIGAGALSLGLGCDIRRKGYHPLWGLWGLVPIMGPILLLLQPPHPQVFDLEYSTDPSSENEVFERASVAQEPAFISGGPLLLAALAPVGIFIHLFCGLAPHFIAVLETTPTRVSVEKDVGAMPSQTAETPTSEKGDQKPEVGKNASADQKEAGAKSENPGSTSEKPAGTSAPAPEPATAPTPPPPVEPPPPPPPVVPAVAPAPPRELSYEEKYQDIQIGLTYEQVCEIIGHDSSLISGTLAGDKIVRWENPDKSYFAARFRGGVLERKTSLSYPPPAKKLEEMAPELRFPGEETENIQSERQAESRSNGAKQNVAYEDENAEDSDDSSETTQEDAETETSSSKDMIRVGGEKAEPRKFKARLPKYTQAIAKGPHDVYFHNESDATVQVALRTQTKRGRNITISSGDEAAAYLPNGTYSIVYISADDPYKLKSAGQLVVASPHETLHVSLN
jgi:hypothetical protein